jgi:hypothetical protein
MWFWISFSPIGQAPSKLKTKIDLQSNAMSEGLSSMNLFLFLKFSSQQMTNCVIMIVMFSYAKGCVCTKKQQVLFYVFLIRGVAFYDQHHIRVESNERLTKRRQ